jgi:fatty aldehyde-generating acyl-ACP reductase
LFLVPSSFFFNFPSFDNLMFGLIGHLTSLEHAQSVANELGYPEYADQGLDFWCSAPPQIVDNITVTSITGQKIEGCYVESCFLPEMLATRRIKAATRKIHTLKKTGLISLH